jgi:hypothetical protein
VTARAHGVQYRPGHRVGLGGLRVGLGGHGAAARPPLAVGPVSLRVKSTSSGPRHSGWPRHWHVTTELLVSPSSLRVRLRIAAASKTRFKLNRLEAFRVNPAPAFRVVGYVRHESGVSAGSLSHLARDPEARAPGPSRAPGITSLAQLPLIMVRRS